jgi:hypothetical protein
MLIDKEFIKSSYANLITDDEFGNNDDVKVSRNRIIFQWDVYIVRFID